MFIKWPLSRVKRLGTIAVLKNFIYCLESRGNCLHCTSNPRLCFSPSGLFKVIYIFATGSGLRV